MVNAFITCAFVLIGCSDEPDLLPADASMDRLPQNDVPSDSTNDVGDIRDGDGCSCQENQFCESSPDACGGPRTCVARGSGICTAEIIPECGCDGVTYDNECRRRYAQVGRARRGPCDGPPPCPRKAPPGCCYEPTDCAMPGVLERCHAALCDANQPGVCLSILPGRCWTDLDCRDGTACNGASYCPCGQDCGIDFAATPGRCMAP